MTHTFHEFKNKRITIMGLGLLGRSVNLTKFFAKAGARITVTDLKSKKALSSSLKKLSHFKNIRYVLGRHRLQDFRNKDFIIKGPGVPFDSPYIREAKTHHIPVKMDASFFAKLASGTMLIGVTGTRGKSTTTHLIYSLLKAAGRRVFLGGNILGMATLPLSETVRAGDIVVLELDSWQLQGFGGARISPHIAVFTNFMRDHQNYYRNNMEHYFRDKANIYRFQKKNDFLVTTKKVAAAIKKSPYPQRSTLLIVPDTKLAPSWKLSLRGTHNAINARLAIAAGNILGLNQAIMHKTLQRFKPLPGRLQYVRTVRHVDFYSDTTATTPDGVRAALTSFPEKKKNIILIGGGSDKNLDYREYCRMVPRLTKKIILLPGSATDKIIAGLDGNNKNVTVVTSMDAAVQEAFASSKKGDLVLLSPGAASFGLFINEFDRGSRFIAAVNKLTSHGTR